MKRIYCAGCLREQDDNGQRQTCSYCSVFPLPSYSYAAGSSFHPDTCDCAVKARPTPKIQPRRTPVPTIKR